MDEANARYDICLHARKMWQSGLVVGSAGNVSRRVGEQLIGITPSSVPYESLTEDQIVLVDLASGQPVDASQVPSYELPMHLVIYRSIPYAHAIMHTHSPYVTTLSVLRRPLPPVIDEMVIYFGGTVAVADYAFTGTDLLGTNVVRALGDHNGAILANHGNVCIGRDLAHALLVALTMESTAQAYVQALQAGEPVALPQGSVAAARRMFEERNRR
ncbi:MAG TPA: class II aldolase/adducin family protein [Thermoanaerobaculia bacterium]|nr:class II aldolase/adducin family protein [Thermoanaerobaculia bacterium]